jgi:hypothetical protein
METCRTFASTDGCIACAFHAHGRPRAVPPWTHDAAPLFRTRSSEGIVNCQTTSCIHVLVSYHGKFYQASAKSASTRPLYRWSARQNSRSSRLWCSDEPSRFAERTLSPRTSEKCYHETQSETPASEHVSSTRCGDHNLTYPTFLYLNSSLLSFYERPFHHHS